MDEEEAIEEIIKERDKVLKVISLALKNNEISDRSAISGLGSYFMMLVHRSGLPKETVKKLLYGLYDRYLEATRQHD